MEHLRPYSLHDIKGGILAHLAREPKLRDTALFPTDLMNAVLMSLASAERDQKYEAWRRQSWEKEKVLITQLGEDTQRLLEAAWELATDGVFFPKVVHRHNNINPHSLLCFQLTQRGRLIVEEGPQDPLHPGFSAKFRTIVMDDEIIARIEDAAECLKKGLLRPAVIMLGLSSETTISIVHNGWSKIHPHISPAAPRTAITALLSDVRSHVENHTRREKKRCLQMAVLGAELVREERNRCAHAGPALLHRREVEELLKSAANSIRNFWIYAVAEIETAGHTPEPY